MARLLLFNPSNDMALAVNSLEYLPPLHIQRMESDLSLLPLWWAEEDDCILMPDNTLRRVDAHVLDTLHDACLHATFDDNDMSHLVASIPVIEASSVCKELVPAPWGWNKALRRRLLRLGISADVMPTEKVLDDYRQLSSRSFACEYLHELFAETERVGVSSSLVGQGMHMLSNLSELDFSLSASRSSFNSAFIFKSPWSSSGRGVWVSHAGESFDEKRILRTIRQQGSILVDDFYSDKLLDFALEFEVLPASSDVVTFPEASASGVVVRFLGFSVFCASDNGNYGYNIVASQSVLRQRILSTGLDACLLDWIIEYSRQHLAQHLYGRYHGCVGIDMLVCRHDDQIKLHPCVEINLRRNMGILALELYRHLSSRPYFLLSGSSSHGFCARLVNEQLSIVFNA